MVTSAVVARPAPAADPRTGPTVSVVICAFTSRRWNDLCGAVASVQHQTVSPDEIVVVIDHNDQLLADAARLPGVRVVASHGPRGLSGARNTGVAAATGHIIFFLDDDAVADTTWVERTLAAFDDRAVVGVGGWAMPRWDSGRPPPWFPRPFLWVVGCSYVGLPTTRAEVRNPIGAAMAFRRCAFDAVGGFSTAVGRSGSRPVGCEETEFAIRLRQADPAARIVVEPSARVGHRVPAERTRFSYLLRRCWYEGQSKRTIAGAVGRQASLSSEHSYVRSVLPRACWAGLVRTLRTRRPEGALSALTVVAGLAAAVGGYALEAARELHRLRGSS